MEMKALKSIIEDLLFNEEFSLQDVVDKGDQALNAIWIGCNHATAGRDFFNLVVKGFYDTKDYQITALSKKNPQKYIKVLVDKPIYLDETSDIDTSVSLLQTLKLLKLVGKTLAIMPTNRSNPSEG